MKKKLFGILIVFAAFFGFFLKEANAKEKVTVYLFSQTTCPHCRDAKAFFKKLKQDKEYKDLFEVRDISVNDKNHKEYQLIFESVAEKMGDEADGVPYYIIGNQSFSKGYSSDWDEEIKKAIKTTYEEENFISPVADLIGNNGEILFENLQNAWIAPVIILIIAFAIIGGTIYFARKSSEDEEDTKISLEKAMEKEQAVVKEKNEGLKKKQPANPRKKKNSSQKKASKKNNV